MLGFFHKSRRFTVGFPELLAARGKTATQMLRPAIAASIISTAMPPPHQPRSSRDDSAIP